MDFWLKYYVSEWSTLHQHYRYAIQIENLVFVH